MKKNIQEATIELLKSKEYKDIRMKEIAKNANIGRRTLYRYYSCLDEIMISIVNGLMDDFSKVIIENKRLDLEGIAFSFFQFWENNMCVIKVLKQAHLLYLMEDNLPDLIREVSFKTKYSHLSRTEFQDIMYQLTDEENYAYCFSLAGYFKVALLWMDEENRKSPEEMARIIRRIVMREPPEM